MKFIMPGVSNMWSVGSIRPSSSFYVALIMLLLAWHSNTVPLFKLKKLKMFFFVTGHEDSKIFGISAW
jgi:hypothetical protein